MRLLLAPVLLLILAAPAFADLEQDKIACANPDEPSDNRILVCERLLASDVLTDEERMLASWDLGEAYLSLDRNAEAVAAFDAAIALAPEDPVLYQRRGLAKANMKDYAGALADFDRAIALEPLDEWSHYARGFVLDRLGRPDEALAAFEQALTLRPLYRSALDAKARLLLKEQRYEEAIAPFDKLLELSPYDPVTYILRGQAYEGLGDRDGAIRDFRVAHLLDPNKGGDYRLDALLPEGLPPPVEGERYGRPQGGLAMTFLQIITIPPPELDEMEAAIADLAGWFAQPELPLPTTKMFMRREVLEQEGDSAKTRTSLLYPGLDEAELGWSEQVNNQLFGLWPDGLGGRDGAPPLGIVYDRNALARLWQQQTGQPLQGRGKVELTCPGPEETPHPIAVAVGCREGVARVPLGSLTWTATIVGWESVLVPAGVFSTVRVEAEMDAVLQMFGGQMEERLSFTWWFDPTLGWWVKRQQRRGDEEQVMIVEAVTIERP